MELGSLTTKIKTTMDMDQWSLVTSICLWIKEPPAVRPSYPQPAALADSLESRYHGPRPYWYNASVSTAVARLCLGLKARKQDAIPTGIICSSGRG